MGKPIAHADVEIKKVPRLVEEEVKLVTLTMDMATAETLRFLCNEVVGSKADTRRKHTSAVWCALGRAGVESPKSANVLYDIDRIRFLPEENL